MLNHYATPHDTPGSTRYSDFAGPDGTTARLCPTMTAGLMRLLTREAGAGLTTGIFYPLAPFCQEGPMNRAGDFMRKLFGFWERKDGIRRVIIVVGLER